MWFYSLHLPRKHWSQFLETREGNAGEGLSLVGFDLHVARRVAQNTLVVDFSPEYHTTDPPGETVAGDRQTSVEHDNAPHQTCEKSKAIKT